MSSTQQNALGIKQMANSKRSRHTRAAANKRVAREQRFIDDATRRKALHHRKEQDAFDAETERLVAYYQSLKDKA